jgi:hypothetical protein
VAWLMITPTSKDRSLGIPMITPTSKDRLLGTPMKSGRKARKGAGRKSGGRIERALNRPG